MRWLIEGLEDFPTCDRDGCNNKITKNVRSVFDGYYSGKNKTHRHCSQKCSALDEVTFSHACETKLERHGDPFWSNREKYVDTCLKRYGVINTFLTENAMNARKENDVYNKAYLTKKKNGTFNASKPEKQVLALLQEAFGEDDVETQVKTTKYPFNCDFYVKSIKTYIEMNLFWTHGFHPFDETNEADVARLNELRRRLTASTKKHCTYKQAIYVWTQLDPKKLRMAKENNLNFKAFYSIDDLKTWLDKRTSRSKI